MKIPSFLLVLIFLASLVDVKAAPKIATVDAGKAMEGYSRAVDDKQAAEDDGAALENDPRKKALDDMTVIYRKALDDLKGIKKNDANLSALTEAAQEAETAHRDLTNQWTVWRQGKMEEITRAFARKTREHFDRIETISARIGDDLGFDWVLETSGASNSHVPVILYLKSATDITEKVVAELNRKAPLERESEMVSPEPASEAEPTPDPGK